MANSFTKASSQTISYAHNNIYDGFGGALTISFWIKVDSWDQLSGVISKRSNASNTISYAVSLYNFFNPTLYLIVGNGAGGVWCQYSIDTTNFPVGEWVNIIAIYNGSLTPTNRIKIYMNGVSQATTPDAESAPLIGNVNFQLYLGRDNEAGTQYLNGKLAEVGVWANALLNTDVLALARGFKPDMVRRASLRFYASLLTGKTYDSKNFFRPTSISSVTDSDHPKLINTVPNGASVFFKGGIDHILTSNLSLDASLYALVLRQDELPSHVGYYCHGISMYINRSEESILHIKT